MYVHVAVRESERVLQTTRADEGGLGVPRAFVLGKGRRVPRAWELALLGDQPQRWLKAAAPCLYERLGCPRLFVCQLLKRGLLGSHLESRPVRPAQALPVIGVIWKAGITGSAS